MELSENYVSIIEDGEDRRHSERSCVRSISVNIGDKLIDVAQSPGMMSLNNVGTINPAHTPGPPDCGQTIEVSGCIVIDPATGTNKVPTSVEVKKTVIEDLRQIVVVTCGATMTEMMEMMLSQNKMNRPTQQ